MKKFLLLLTIILSSCHYLPTGNVMEDPYIVKSIERYCSIRGLCKYNISTGLDNINYIDDITIIDSIGKFTIGDSVVLCLNFILNTNNKLNN